MMEQHMIDLARDTTDVTPRRRFFGRLGGVAVLGLMGLVPKPLQAQTPAAQPDGPDWPGPLKGRYRQVTDAYDIYGGSPLNFAYNFLAPNQSATAVVVLRHFAFPLALNHAMWAKYKIGENLKVN